MTGFRTTPSDEFVREVVSIFLSRPQMDRVQEIHLRSLQQEDIIREMVGLFPTLQMYYYPGKLAQLVTRDGSSYTFTFAACTQILRQVLRVKGYKVRTRTIRKQNVIDKIIVIIPSVTT